MGLIGAHAYTITGETSLHYEGKKVDLLRIRNPWGSSTGEWRGAWSDASQEWEYIMVQVDPSL